MFSDEPGTYEICEICGWEDDPVQLRHPLMGGGANKLSLVLSQELALKAVPVEIEIFQGYVRDPEWYPLKNKDLGSSPLPQSGIEYFNASGDDVLEYYWRRSRSES